MTTDDYARAVRELADAAERRQQQRDRERLDATAAAFRQRGRDHAATTNDSPTAIDYRTALCWTLHELEDLDLNRPVETAERLEELRGHLRTLLRYSDDPPLVGLEGLRVLAMLRLDRRDRR